MYELGNPNPKSTPFWLWEERRAFLTVQKTELNCKQVFLQVPQERWEVGTFGRASWGRGRPGGTSPSSCPGGARALASHQGTPSLPARPALPILQGGG